LVRISEETNIEATRISTIAFRVAALALFVAVFQTGISLWDRISPLECQEPIQTQIEKETFVKPTPQLHKSMQKKKQNLPTDKEQDSIKKKEMI